MTAELDSGSSADGAAVSALAQCSAGEPDWWGNPPADWSRSMGHSPVIARWRSPVAGRDALAQSWLSLMFMNPGLQQFAVAYSAGAVSCCQQDAADAIARQVIAAMRSIDVDWMFRVLTGAVAGELDRVAHRLEADAVIVGHSRRRLRLSGRSVAARLNRFGRHVIVAVP